MLLLVWVFGASLRAGTFSHRDLGLEPTSFGLGVLAALSVVWVMQLPWKETAVAILDSLKRGGRNAALFVLAAGFASVLLLR
jgi:hypothetical protein